MKTYFEIIFLTLILVSQNSFSKEEVKDQQQTAMSKAQEIIKTTIINELLRGPELISFDEMSFDYVPSNNDCGGMISFGVKNLVFKAPFNINISHQPLQEIPMDKGMLSFSLMSDQSTDVSMVIEVNNLKTVKVSFKDENQMPSRIFLGIYSNEVKTYSMSLEKSTITFEKDLGAALCLKDPIVKAFSLSGTCSSVRKLDDRRDSKKVLIIPLTCKYSFKMTAPGAPPEIHFSFKEGKPLTN